MGLRLKYRIILKLLKICFPDIYSYLYKESAKGNFYIKELTVQNIRKTPRPSVLFAKSNLKKCENAIEIGTNKGFNAISIFKQLNPAQLYLVDPWKNKKVYNIVKNRFKNYNNVHFIKQPSMNAFSNFSDNYFDFIYIDALHNYDSVFEDLTS